MSRTLCIARDLVLPIEAATQTFLIVGKRGSGKTSTGVRLAEQFYKARVPFAVVDPVDVWWGLKASRKGGTGLGVYVFGGRHADLPLEPTTGELIADVLVEHRISVVLSVKHFSGRERDRFMGDFAARLFQRNTEPLHLFLEEAHEVAPQHPYKGEEQMLHHVRRIWKLGRASGLGGSAITQRPASLDKNITTQAEILVVHRTIGPQDVAAIREWIRYHGEREDILAQLAMLKTGEAFIWAPDFPEGKPIDLQRMKVFPRETFDSSATPKTGERRAEPKALAQVDLEQLQKRMAATIERAKAEDPRELRRRIAELERELKNRTTIKKVKAAEEQAKTFAELKQEIRLLKVQVRAQPTKTETREIKVTDHAVIERAIAKRDAVYDRQMRKLTSGLITIAGLAESLVSKMTLTSAEIIPAEKRLATGVKPLSETNPYLRGGNSRRLLTRSVESSTAIENDGATLGKCEAAILATLAQHGECDMGRLALLSGYRKSGGFKNSISKLRGLSYLEGPNIGIMRITEAGFKAGVFDALPAGEDLFQYWLNSPRIGVCEREIMKMLDGRRDGSTMEEIAENTGYALSGGFKNSLSKLRTAGVIVGRNTERMRLSEELL